MLTKLWGLRWWMMGLLMLGSVINYLTRATLAVAAPTVLKDLDITTQQYSWILSAFQLAIMLQPLCGYVMDSVGLKLGFAIFAIAWSFISMAHGLASSWPTLFGLRALLGFAEGSANPSSARRPKSVRQLLASPCAMLMKDQAIAKMANPSFSPTLSMT